MSTATFGWSTHACRALPPQHASRRRWVLGADRVLWQGLIGACSGNMRQWLKPVRCHTAMVPASFPTVCCYILLQRAQVGMPQLRDVFINSLCSFTHLHSPPTMRPKNALAFKYLLKVADAVGDHLAER